MTGKPPHKLVICVHFKPELDSISTTLASHGVEVAYYDGKCGRPPVSWKDVAQAIGPVEDFERIDLVGGCCLPVSKTPPVDLRINSITTNAQCFELIADKEIVSQVSKDQYVVSPGWIATWRETIEEWGFDQATARDFFSESANAVLLLDTGSDPQSKKHFQEFCCFIGLEGRMKEIGIATFKNTILSIVKKSCQVEGDPPGPENSSFPSGESILADYAMAMDLLGQLGSAASLEVAVERIASIFYQITATKQIRILYLDDNGNEFIYSYFEGTDKGEVKSSLRDTASPVEKTSSGKGFLLPIEHNGQRLAIIELESIPNTDSLSHYMNFAINIAPVCSMGLVNASRFTSLCQAQDSLAVSKQRMELALSGSQLGIWEWNVATDETYFCDHCFTMLGYEPNDFPAGFENWELLTHPDDRSVMQEALHGMLVNHDHSYNCRFRLKNKEGQYRWILGAGKATQFSPDGATVLKASGTRKDITNEVQLEEQLRHAHKMEAIGTLAGGISHDFNNILAAVIGYTELGLLEVESNSQLEKYLNKIFVSSNRAKDIVKQILAFSRHDAVKLAPINVTNATRNCLEMVRTSTASSIAIHSEIDQRIFTVLGDISQFNQFFLNLFINATHAMPEGGEIRVSLSLDAKKNKVVLEVSDTGVGISSDSLEKIFDPYYTTKDVGSGSGLGLAVVKGILSSWGADIRVKSRWDVGTTFTVEFPFLDKNEPVEDLTL